MTCAVGDAVPPSNLAAGESELRGEAESARQAVALETQRAFGAKCRASQSVVAGRQSELIVRPRRKRAQEMGAAKGSAQAAAEETVGRARGERAREAQTTQLQVKQHRDALRNEGVRTGFLALRMHLCRGPRRRRGAPATRRCRRRAQPLAREARPSPPKIKPCPTIGTWPRFRGRRGGLSNRR